MQVSTLKRVFEYKQTHQFKDDLSVDFGCKARHVYFILVRNNIDKA